MAHLIPIDRLWILRSYFSTFKTLVKKAVMAKNRKIVHELHKQNNLEGLLISSLSFLSKLRFNEIETSEIEEHKVKIIKKSFKIIQLLGSSLTTCDLPLHAAKILVKLAYHDIDSILNFLKNLFNEYKNQLSDYNDSLVKGLIRSLLKHIDSIVDLTFSYPELRDKLNSQVRPIYEVCFSFLKFQQFDLDKLAQNPFDLMVDIEDVTGSCVINLIIFVGKRRNSIILCQNP